MNLDAWASYLGYAVMVSGGAIVVAALAIWAVSLLNRATWQLLEGYGSIKTFIKFRDWYWKQPENQKGHSDAP